jgi:hypothetical protein
MVVKSSKVHSNSCIQLPKREFYFGILGFELWSHDGCRQVLYLLSHANSPLCFSYFSGKVLLPHPMLPHLAGITDLPPPALAGPDRGGVVAHACNASCYGG